LSKHQRSTDQHKPVPWTYYEVEPDPAGGWRLVEVERKPMLEFD
jgi:hypothetical protein